MIKRTDRVLTLSPTSRRLLPNGMSADVARVIRAHGYRIDGAALLAALRELLRDADSDRARAYKDAEVSA